MVSSKHCVVIDNGSYESRSGYLGNLVYRFPNKYYKLKDNILFSKNVGVEKCMFDNDIITNFEISETIFDKIFKEIKLKEPDELIFTEKFNSPNFSRRKLLELFFEVYNFNKVQLGNDAVYAANKNGVKNNALLISMSNNGTYFVDLYDQIKAAYFLNFGGKQCKKYIQEILITKLNIKKPNEDMINDIVSNLYVCNDYEEEVLEIFKNSKEGSFNDEYKPEFLKEEVEDTEEVKKPPPKKVKKGFEKKVEPESEGSSDEEFEEESEENLTSEESVIEEVTDSQNYEKKEEKLIKVGDKEMSKKETMLYFSTIYRLKQRIQKELINFKDNITKLEEKYEITYNLERYLQKLKERIENYKNQIKTKENILRELRNRRSIYSLVRTKEVENIVTEKELEVYDKVVWAENSEYFIQLEKELNNCVGVVQNYIPNYMPFVKPTPELIPILAIERRKIPEFFFKPNIVNTNGLGITEVIARSANTTVFLTGGMAKIQGLKERVYNEKRSYSQKDVEVIVAKDFQLDSFFGAEFLDILPTFNKEEYYEEGIESLLDKMVF